MCFRLSSSPLSSVPLLFPGTPVLAILLPTDTIFDTEQRKLGFSFESSTASKFTDWTNIDASFDLIMMLFVSIFINSIDGNWDEKKDFPGR